MLFPRAQWGVKDNKGFPFQSQEMHLIDFEWLATKTQKSNQLLALKRTLVRLNKPIVNLTIPNVYDGQKHHTTYLFISCKINKFPYIALYLN